MFIRGNGVTLRTQKVIQRCFFACVEDLCVFITAGPMIKLCAGGEGDSEGHVL